jgi:Alkaline phosphatase
MREISFFVLSLFLLCLVDGHVVPLHQSAADQHMHPPPTAFESRSRVKRDEKFHQDGFESTSKFWRVEAQKKLRNQLDKKLNDNVAKNLIMFLGDGMSISTITAARIYFGQKQGFSGEESVLSFEEFPHLGLSKVSAWRFRILPPIYDSFIARLTASTSKQRTQRAPRRLILLA